MSWKILEACAFIGLSIYFAYDAVKYFNREDVNKLVPGWRYLRLPGAILLFIISVLALLDSLGLLHRSSE